MDFTSLKDLVLIVYDEIRDRNSRFTGDAVPISSQLIPLLAQKYSLDTGKIPALFEILVKSKMIFAFPVTSNEGSHSDQKFGFVITKGDVIQSIRKKYEQLFEKLYTDEFHKKVPVEKLILEFTSRRSEFNDTPLGIFAGIVTMLQHYQSLLERNILQYSDKNKEKELAVEIGKCGPIKSYFNDSYKPAQQKNNNPAPASKQSADAVRRAVDTPRYDELKAYTSNNSMEKTLKLYGVEFYTRVCFREYKFNHVQRVIEDDFIKKTGDLKTIKTLLEKERMNSDKDIRINEYASEINSLMKCINNRLKK